MCYLGGAETFTPMHKDNCASTGQNLMVYTKDSGSAVRILLRILKILDGLSELCPIAVLVHDEKFGRAKGRRFLSIPKARSRQRKLRSHHRGTQESSFRGLHHGAEAWRPCHRTIQELPSSCQYWRAYRQGIVVTYDIERGRNCDSP